jgi:hypothetical protein
MIFELHDILDNIFINWQISIEVNKKLISMRRNLRIGEVIIYEEYDYKGR